jgi:hypothetical protein
MSRLRDTDVPSLGHRCPVPTMTGAPMSERPARQGRASRRRDVSTSPGAIRSRRHRARQHRGKAVAPVEYDSYVVGLLVRLGWLGGDEVADSREIGRAIAAMLAEAA